MTTHPTAADGVRTGLSYDEASYAILHALAPCGSEDVSLEAALGRALARDVVADIALPPWDNSGMDGYAVRRVDVHNATPETPVVLRVIGTIVAGGDEQFSVAPGTCTRIMTGAPIPHGADAVIRIEDTDRGTERVTVHDARDAHARNGNVRPRGEDVRPGDLVLPAGTTLGGAQLGVLASVGCTTVPVFRAPRVTVLSSGDELVLVDDFAAVRAGRRIVSSSSYALPPLLASVGAQVRTLPLIPDNPDAMADAMRSAVHDGCDLLITTGGVSVGAHDHVRSVLMALGGTVTFWRARIRPGGPVGFGAVLGVPWLGLPGNPVSTLVTAELFARPAVRRLGGHVAVRPRVVKVQLAEAVSAPAPLTFFLRALVAPDKDGGLSATLAGRQGSNLLATLARANALLVVQGPMTEVPAGTMVDALLLDGALLDSVSA